jgi:hypothetical protein
MTIPTWSLRFAQRLHVRTLVFATLALAGGLASAANFNVICPGGGPGAYPSITAALNAITNNAGPNSITVSGTCTENLTIRNQNDLIIQAAAGTTPVITNAANPAQITVQLFGSHLVAFFGLNIRGGNAGVFVNQGSDLQIFNSVIENNVADGVVALIKSALDLGSCVIRNNGGNGVVIGDSSAAVVMSPIQVLNNGGPGVNAFSSGYIKFQAGGSLIEGNAGPGIIAGPDGHVLINGAQPTVIRNNNGGLIFQDGSTGLIQFQNTIDGNGPFGVLVESSIVSFQGVPVGSTISGHADAGAVVRRGGELLLDGQHLITGNGTGVRLERSSLTVRNGASISNNGGFGIRGDANSGVVVGPSGLVENNSSVGIRVSHQSLIGLTAPVTIQGNGAASIVCDSTSLAYGQLAGITQLQCENN